MPRNQSEKLPVVIREKSVTPAAWDHQTEVRLVRMLDSSYCVSIEDLQDDDNTWVEQSLTLDRATTLYEELVTDFYFSNLSARFPGVTNWEGNNAT